MAKGGCTVGTADAPAPFRIVDLDHAAAPVRPNASKCDYLFLAEADGGRRLRVVPLEMKATALNPSKVASQLQAGARVADDLVRGASPVRFTPVAAYGRNPHRRQYRKLADVKIKCRNSEYAIVTMQCGSPLALALQ